MISSKLIALVPIAVISLLWIAIATDLTDRRIPNWISMGVIALFLVYCVLKFGEIALATHFFWAFATFLCLFFVFALGKIGGGDVKLSTAVMLWAGPDQGVRFLFLTAIAGGVLAFMVLAPTLLKSWFWRWFGKERQIGLEDVCRQASVPYGLAISLAGTVCLYEGFLIMDYP